MARHPDVDRRRVRDKARPGTVPTPGDVARRAYELYEARGSEPGADLDDWLRAERDLRAVRSGDGPKKA